MSPIGTEFIITLFPNDAIHVRTLEVTQQDGRAGCWRGLILEPRPEYTVPDPTTVEGQAEIEELSEFSLCWTFANIGVTGEVAASIQEGINEDRAAGRGFQPVDPANVPHIEAGSPWAVYRLSAYINFPMEDNPTLIQGILEDPRYHIVYEEDPDKAFGGRDAADHAAKFEEFCARLRAEERSGSKPSQ